MPFRLGNIERLRQSRSLCQQGLEREPSEFRRDLLTQSTSALTANIALRIAIGVYAPEDGDPWPSEAELEIGRTTAAKREKSRAKRESRKAKLALRAAEEQEKAAKAQKLQKQSLFPDDGVSDDDLEEGDYLEYADRPLRGVASTHPVLQHNSPSQPFAAMPPLPSLMEELPPLSNVATIYHDLPSKAKDLLSQVGDAMLAAQERDNLKLEVQDLTASMTQKTTENIAMRKDIEDMESQLANTMSSWDAEVARVREEANEDIENTRSDHQEALQVEKNRYSTLEKQLDAVQKELKKELQGMEARNCCQMCGDDLGSFLEKNGQLGVNILKCSTCGPAHLMCGTCFEIIMDRRFNEGNLTDLPCVHCGPTGGVFVVEDLVPLISPCYSKRYDDIKIEQEVTRRAAAAALPIGPLSFEGLSAEEAADLPEKVQAELKKAQCFDRAYSDAFTIKAPCCGTAVTNFEGCVAMTCGQCDKFWCALCFTVFANDHATHQHLTRTEAVDVTDGNRDLAPVRAGTFDYNRMAEDDRPLFEATELGPCPCRSHGHMDEPFYFTSPSKRAWVKRCWEHRAFMQMPRLFDGHQIEDPQNYL